MLVPLWLYGMTIGAFRQSQSQFCPALCVAVGAFASQMEALLRRPLTLELAAIGAVGDAERLLEDELAHLHAGA